jgi:hypothetical protein
MSVQTAALRNKFVIYLLYTTRVRDYNCYG